MRWHNVIQTNEFNRHHYVKYNCEEEKNISSEWQDKINRAISQLNSPST